MKFETDNQTLDDLEIFGTLKNKKSVFDMFCHTQCVGGKNMLQDIFKYPLTDMVLIQERIDAVSFFQSYEGSAKLEIDKNTLDFIEHYLAQGNYPTTLPSRYYAIEKGMINKLMPSNEYYIVERGVDYTIDLINSLHTFLQDIPENECPTHLQRHREKISLLFEDNDEYIAISEIAELKKLGSYKIARFDYMFRYSNKDDVRFFLDTIYEYDAFLSIAKTKKRYGFAYPDISSDNMSLEIEELFHPFLKNPVKNDVKFRKEENILFVTGSNMAGKSTFLKALGIAIYLAHCGLPVPAKRMTFSLLSGIYTTINLSDSLKSGYSHFYSEVKRIKYIAEQLKTNNLLVIFDELFRGTNVKDAYDGSLAVISAFTDVRNSFFAISTHIVEVADVLKNIDNVQFGYLEIFRRSGFPEYTYKLKNGISEDRLGMHILREEGLIETIKNINN